MDKLTETSLLHLQAAAAQADVRNKILESIESVPDDIEEISGCLDRFNGVVNNVMWEKLTNKALKLHVGILAAVEGMLRWLDENAFCEFRCTAPSLLNLRWKRVRERAGLEANISKPVKLVKSLMLQTAYGTNVKADIESMTKLSADLRRYAQTCAEDVIVGVSKQTSRIEALSKQHLSITTENVSMTSDIYQQGGQIIGRIESLDTKMEDSSKQTQAALTAAEGTLELLNDDLKALQSTLQESECESTHLSPSTQRSVHSS